MEGVMRTLIKTLVIGAILSTISISSANAISQAEWDEKIAELRSGETASSGGEYRGTMTLSSGVTVRLGKDGRYHGPRVCFKEPSNEVCKSHVVSR
jgi:hypothetical protein